MLTIRPAVLNDAEATARLNFVTWATSFRGLVPDAWLAARDIAKHIAQFQKRFTTFGYQGMHIAEIDGTVVGFADGGATRDKSLPFDAELYAIYILKEHQGKGVGKMLFHAVAKKVREDGFHSMVVKTFSTSPFLRFYIKQGGESVYPYSEDWEVGGAKIPLVAFGWKDLSDLGGI